MTNIDPVHRLDAKEALDRLGTVICSMTPKSLLIKPAVIKIWPLWPYSEEDFHLLYKFRTFIRFICNICTVGPVRFRCGTEGTVGLLTKGSIIVTVGHLWYLHWWTMYASEWRPRHNSRKYWRCARTLTHIYYSSASVGEHEFQLYLECSSIFMARSNNKMHLPQIYFLWNHRSCRHMWSH